MTIKRALLLVIGCFLALMLLNTWVGWQTSGKLSDLLSYITGPAWDTADGAMEGQIGVQQKSLRSISWFTASWTRLRPGSRSSVLLRWPTNR